MDFLQYLHYLVVNDSVLIKLYFYGITFDCKGIEEIIILRDLKCGKATKTTIIICLLVIEETVTSYFKVVFKYFNLIDFFMK